MHKKLYFFVAILLMVSMLAPTAFAQEGGPTRHNLVTADGAGVSDDTRVGLQTSGPVAVVVHLNQESLARAGQEMTPEERVAYAASIAALQDQVAAQVEAIGGRVLGRFKTLSSGLAVEIDAEKLDDLRSLANVTNVRRVNDYELYLNETVPWIGAAAAQDLGYDGTGISVAVIDSGIDYTHAKLGGPGTLEAYAEAYCGDPLATPNPNDPTCTAFDSADVTGFFPNSKVRGGFDYVGEQWPFGPQTFDDNPIDFDGHGSHVADIIAGLPLADYVRKHAARTRVRVAHLSPDAPNVDILVNDAVAFADVPFQEITDYAALPAGTYNVKVVPAGATSPVVIEADLTLTHGVDYTVAAVNELHSIEPLVLVDDNTLPAPGDAHVRFLHASPDAPAVDIAVAGGGPVLFGNVAFRDVSGYLPVPAGVYDLEVRLAGTNKVVLSLPGITLDPDKVYTAYAVGLVKANSLSAVVSVDAPPVNTASAYVRVAHLSPGAPNVDILVNDAVAFADVSFQEITDYAALPAGTYNVKVVPAGATSPVVIEADLTLAPGMDYTVAAVNVLASIEPLVLADNNTPPASGNAHVRFLHASPDAPAVDIAVAGGGPVLFGNVAFKETGDYLPVPAGVYDLEVRLAGTNTVVLPLPGIRLEADNIYTAYAVGLVADNSLAAVLSLDLDGDAAGPGVAPAADIYGFKACSAVSTSCNGVALLLSVDDAADLDDDPATFDPVDVINMSLGSAYGQPEDDLTAFSNEVTLLGTVVVAAAGNSADKPFIVSTPSAATAALSVAWTTVPSAAVFKIRRNTPEPVIIIEEAVQFPWTAPLTGEITGDVVYGNGDGTNLDGCAPFTADLTGKVSVVDRGACFFSTKVQNAEAAGAILSIVVQNTPDPPFAGGFGGGPIPNIPGFMIAQADGDPLKVVGANVTMDPNDPQLITLLPDTVVSASARGPRNHDNFIKPDIGAPGASVSAEVGTGTGTTAFGGTSGATPMVSGAAALLKQKYGGTPLLGAIGRKFGPEMPVWMYKALLMNTAETEIWQDMPGGTLAPISRIGGGRVDALSAINSETVAWDETNAPIDPRFRTGSMSFGFQTVRTSSFRSRSGFVANMSDQGRWYHLSAAFRYPEDEGMGVKFIKVSPEHLYVPAHSYKRFNVTLQAKAEDLPAWDVFGFNKGGGGADGDGLTAHEFDGYLTIDGGENNTVHLAWHTLPKRVARVVPTASTLNFSGSTTKKLFLHNQARWQEGDVDLFSLVDVSPNIYNYLTFTDLVGTCTSVGLLPGCNQTRVDIKEVGVRHLPFVFEDGLIEFGLTIWDHPYRASEYPVAFDVYVDSPVDGLGDADPDPDDFLVRNGDLGSLTGGALDGRNVVAVFDLINGGGAIYFFTDSGFNTQNWILTAPTFALGLAPGDQFGFRVEAWDAYFTGTTWDCSPGDCTSYHTFSAGVPKYAVDDPFPAVPPKTKLDLTVTQVPGGDVASPSQIGLLLMYRQAEVGHESDTVLTLP